tara:strand:- start:406 stop:666 length:261 start_codon:yes stop_codon:yes gene_type:complete
MPYHTKKVEGGVKNVNKKTGKATSKKPMTKANAEKQKKAIAMSEKEKKMDKKDKKMDKKEHKGLTEKQKKLPKKLQEAIMKKKNKK